MNRSQLILSVALLVVSGTVAFTISFRHQEKLNSASNTKTGQPADQISQGRLSERGPEPEARLLNNLRTHDREMVDETHYEISISREEDRDAAIKIEDDSREKLEDLTLRYQLTPSQRREIFPIIAGFHPLFREGMLVNGQTVPRQQYMDKLNSSPEAFEHTIHPILDTVQQEALETDILSKDDWWADVSNQHQDDTHQAIESGELIPTPIHEPDKDIKDSQNIQNSEVDEPQLPQEPDNQDSEEKN